MPENKGTCGECEHYLKCAVPRFEWRTECPARTSERRLQEEMEEAWAERDRYREDASEMRDMCTGLTEEICSLRTALERHINCNKECEGCREVGCVLRTDPRLPSEVIMEGEPEGGTGSPLDAVLAARAEKEGGTK